MICPFVCWNVYNDSKSHQENINVNIVNPCCNIRILVTGTRGKSSLVRLLHAGLLSLGLKAYARITGVLPRSITPEGIRIIHRDSPVNFREMLWWLKSLPPDAEAVIMENSAVNPEFQPAAAKWLKPTLTVITNTRPDHQDAWGYGKDSARLVIMQGVPENVPVISGKDMPVCPDYREQNIALALEALRLSGSEVSREVLENVPPDVADFRILGDGEELTACAFSANDVESTEMLFALTGWDSREVTLLYHHRPDRTARLKVFMKWIHSREWRDIVMTNSREPFSFEEWRKNRGKIFACGNVAGWPLEYMLCTER